MSEKFQQLVNKKLIKKYCYVLSNDYHEMMYTGVQPYNLPEDVMISLSK